MIKVKRVYALPEKKDGYRILVDRLWPRGLPKEKAKIDLWLKEIAPTDQLRKWFSHDPKKWDEFKAKYRTELKDKKESLEKVRKLEREEKIITFLYAAKDQKHNNAVALKEVITGLKI
ncbi:MAG TPA: DUF488 domain-containing protein [Nitrospiria bacterium]|jgi:uncharacterized protein YeaO (DUF488 family)